MSTSEADGVVSADVYRAQEQAKPWGHEVIFAAIEGKYVGKVIHVNAGHSLSTQYHLEKEETISVLKGEALVEYGTDPDGLTSARFVPGDTIHLPPGVVHRIEAVTDVVFAECSTAHAGWRHDVVRLNDAYGRVGTQEP